MDFSLKTPEQVRALIAATHSDTRPDPYRSWSPVELRRFADSLWSGFSRAILRVWIEPSSAPLPEPEIEVIEDYLLELYVATQWDEAAIQERLAALWDGAAPTREEMQAFQDWFNEEGCLNDWPVFYVFQVAPDGAAPCVYFVCQHIESDRHSDPVDAVGPLRSPEEVVTHWIDTELARRGRAHFEPWDEDGRRLEEMYIAARLLVP